MKKVLITAFEPFDQGLVNESMLVLEKLPQSLEWTADGQQKQLQIEKVVLPVTFSSSRILLEEQLRLHQPDALLSLGLAKNRTELTFERVAINLIDARIPDNIGEQPIDVPCVEKGEIAYFTSLPIKPMIEASQKVVPSKISETAGTYVCNYIMYMGLYLAQKCDIKPFKSGFIHLPPQEVMAPCDIAKALEEALKIL